jgi:hypothetical protein
MRAQRASSLFLRPSSTARAAARVPASLGARATTAIADLTEREEGLILHAFLRFEIGF